MTLSAQFQAVIQQCTSILDDNTVVSQTGAKAIKDAIKAKLWDEVSAYEIHVLVGTSFGTNVTPINGTLCFYKYAQVNPAKYVMVWATTRANEDQAVAKTVLTDQVKALARTYYHNNLCTTSLSQQEKAAKIKELIKENVGGDWEVIVGSSFGGQVDVYQLMFEKMPDGQYIQLWSSCFPRDDVPKFQRFSGQGSAAASAAKIKVFVSYVVRESKQEALRIKRQLGASFEVFVSENDIEPGEDWVRKMEVALDQCDLLLMLITPCYADPVASKWTYREVVAADANNKKLLSCWLGGDYPPPNVKTILTPEQYVDCRSGMTDDHITQIGTLIKKKCSR